MNITSLEATVNYIENLKVIYPAIEGRIEFVRLSEHEESKSGAVSIVTISSSIKSITICLLLVQIISMY